MLCRAGRSGIYGRCDSGVTQCGLAAQQLVHDGVYMGDGMAGAARAPTAITQAICATSAPTVLVAHPVRCRSIRTALRLPTRCLAARMITGSPAARIIARRRTSATERRRTNRRVSTRIWGSTEQEGGGELARACRAAAADHRMRTLTRPKAR